jgi:hypothetical protein
MLTVRSLAISFALQPDAAGPGFQVQQRLKLYLSSLWMLIRPHQTRLDGLPSTRCECVNVLPGIQSNE